MSCSFLLRGLGIRVCLDLVVGLSPQGVVHLNGRELLFGEAKQLRLAVGYILSPWAAVVAEKSGEEIDPIP
jgi:hypothetical protein